MNSKSVSCKAFWILAAITMAFAASLLLGGTQAHAASNTVARIVSQSGYVMGSYDNLQAAFNAVKDDQVVELMSDTETNTGFKINRNKTFTFNLHEHTITGTNKYNIGYLLHIENGSVTIVDHFAGSGSKGALVGHYLERCIRLSGGSLHIMPQDSRTKFSGGRVADVYGGELHISNGTYENSIVVYNSQAQIKIDGGCFEKAVNISAKGKNACNMEITGGEFLAKLTNTGKTAFIKGGTFHYLRMPAEKYIHPEYTKVETTMSREGKTEKAYRIVKRPPSVAFTPDSGSVQYDPTGTGTQVTAKVVDSNMTTELTPATFKWYKGEALLGESATITLNESGTYKAVATYNNATYEAEYVVMPADISSGYTSSIPTAPTFTGFPFGADFVKDNLKLYEKESSNPINGFTFDVKSTGENTNAGTNSGTYTIEGTGNYTGALSGTFNIDKANFDQVAFTVSPAEAAYTGVSIQPTVTGTLTTGGKTHTLDSSEYGVSYSNNINVGTASATVTSKAQNFTDGNKNLNFSITKAPNNVSVSIEGWASGETAKVPHVEASSDADKATYKYKVKGADDSTYSSAVPTAPGDYTVKASIPEGDNYEAGAATADFTIGPMQLTIDFATAATRTYEKGNKAVDITGVTFKNRAGNPVALTLGTDYIASGTVETDSAGTKNVTVAVELKNGDYSLPEGGNTAATTMEITKAAIPPQNVKVAGYISPISESEGGVLVSQSVANMMPEDAGTSLEYNTGTYTAPSGVTVSGFTVSENGLVTATLTGVEQGDDSKNVILPVTVTSQNYADAVINVVVVPKDKTIKTVTITGDTTAKTYGDSAFPLTATVEGDEAAQPGDWYWYSSDPNVLSVDEKGSNTMSITVKGAGSAMIMAWYEPSDNSRQYIGAAVTEAITVNKRPLTFTAKDQASIYVGGTLPTLPSSPVQGTDYTIEPDEGGLANGDSLSGLTLSYSSEPVNTKPGTYSIIPSAATVTRTTGSTNVTSNYAITYESGTFQVKPKETQTIAAEDVTATYGDENARVSATTSGDGTISYAVKEGSGDCVEVNANTGALTIKKAGTATVTVTASETSTYARMTKDVTVTVSKANPVPANVTANEWVYDGSERRLVIAESAAVGGTMQYSLDGQTFSPTIPTATNAGVYAVWYKVAGDENHNDTEAQKIDDINVDKADPIVDAPGPLTATCGDLLEDVKLPSVSNGTWSWGADPGARVEHAGECYFDATFTPNDTNNYTTIPGVYVRVDAAKGESSVSAAPRATNPVYNGAAQALVTAGKATGGTMQYSLDGEEFYDDIPVGYEAGSYTVWHMVAGDENHNDSAPASMSATISKADISAAKVTLAQASYVYDGKAKQPPVASVVLNGRRLSPGTDYAVGYRDNVKAGTAAAVVTGKGNYAGQASAAFSIQPPSRQMFRLYNPYSGEHFYTGDAAEKNHLAGLGWRYEGVGWNAPTSGRDVFRLYNRFSGDHHFTLDAHERDVLVSLGWAYEGVGWKSGGTRPVYREYNPYAAAAYHNYTANATEHNHLCSIGWKDEGVGWYGM